jgi:hypothetical protein
MTASVQLTEDEVEELRELTRVNDLDTAVRSALAEYRRYARRMRLKAATGEVEMRDNWRSLEASEIDAARLD